MATEITLNAVGRTPLVQVEQVYVKMECANPGGSVKDRIAPFLLRRAMRRGELSLGDTVVEATSGNTGIALALAGRELGVGVLIFMPEHMSAERRRIMERAGAEVRLTPRAESFAGACARRDAYRGRYGYWIPDQFGNPDNTLCHRETTGAELIVQLRAHRVARLDAFVAGVGTGGTLMGVGEALREEWPAVQLVAVEPEESPVLSGGEPGEHGIFGIGDGFVPALVDRARIGEVARVSTAAAHAECHRLRREHGWCVGRSSGANMIAARALAERGLVVATLWPDSADRYGSCGLVPPGGEGTRCPLRETCEQRMRELLGGDGATLPDSAPLTIAAPLA